MRYKVLLPVLSLLALACAGLGRPEPVLRLDAAPPASFILDGNVAEWTEAPALALGKAQLASGQVSSDSDLSATIWWSLDSRGLVIAGQVHDDKVELARDLAATPVADGVSIWVAMRPAELPPIGFANQFGDTTVESAAACDTLEGVDPASCKTWFAEQTALREKLARIPVRRYQISAAGAVENWSGQCGADVDLSPDTAVTCAQVVTAFVPTRDGYTFEVQLPLEVLPPTAELPLANVKLLIDVLDSDGDGAPAMLSASPARKDGDVGAFLPFTLASPIVVDTQPAVVGQLMARAPAPGFFYSPGERLDHAWVFENLAEGYQTQPTQPSPSVVPLNYGVLPEVGTLGVLHVYLVTENSAFCSSCTPGGRLVVVEGDKVIADRSIGNGTLRAVVTRTPGLQLATEEEGTLSPLGTGQCGACTMHSVRVFGLTQAGAFTELLSDEAIEGAPLSGPNGEVFYSDVTVDIPSSLDEIRFSGTQEHLEGGETEPFSRVHRWDAATNIWLKSGESDGSAAVESASSGGGSSASSSASGGGASASAGGSDAKQSGSTGASTTGTQAGTSTRTQIPEDEREDLENEDPLDLEPRTDSRSTSTRGTRKPTEKPAKTETTKDETTTESTKSETTTKPRAKPR